jgi:hypothetical protein
MVEALEERKLMSLTVDVRVAGGGTTASPTKVGQVINLEVWATATGANSVGTDEGFQDVLGSFVSKNISGFAALGTLKATISAPFNGNGSTSGTLKDLDGDGDIDVGTLDPGSVNNPDENFFARSNSITTTGGTAVSKGQSWKIADLTFTVTKLGSGTTSIQFIPENTTGNVLTIGVWREDGANASAGSAPFNKGTLVVGSAVTLKQNIGSISGKIWNDKNSNGTREATEPGAGVWQVYIDSNKNGALDTGELSVKSSAGGNYVFSKLKGGKYRIRIVPQAKWRKTFPGSSFRDVVLGIGTNVTGRNFGMTTNSIIPGSVFNDANNNGVKDIGEGGLAGWRVFADADFDGKFNKKIDTGVLTDANGNFVFNTLPGGKWLIVPSMTATSRLSSQSKPFTVVKVAAGAQAKAIKFGIFPNA